jgi:choline dehydrogenase
MIWDYIIVGAGSAGCALAYELAQSRRENILVLEAGGPDRSPFIRFPSGQARAVSRHDWGYRSQPDPSRKGAAEPWARGRVIGGSSSINGTLYARGAHADFDGWALHCGHRGNWSARDVMGILREMEISDQPGSARGHAGQLHVRTVKHIHAVTQAFISAAQTAGVPFNVDYNGETQEGVSLAQLSQYRGLRCSAADAFLKPLKRERHVEIRANAFVHRIELAGGRAIAVCGSIEGRAFTERARDIILSAGALNSPKLLMLSGIGDTDELQNVGITPRIFAPSVGRNLLEHPLLKLTYRMRVPTFNLTEGLTQKLAIAMKFLRFREGPISNIFEAAAFLKTRPTALQPDIQLHFLPVGYVRMPEGIVRLTDYPAVTVLLNASYPKSRGRIRLASSEVTDAPLIECRLLDEEDDVETLVRGVTAVRRIMAAEPMAALVDGEVAPGSAFESAAALGEYVRAHTEISFHPSGTCRMGVDSDAVVSPELLVRGTENLWVADASIMPSLISGNTNAVCMMIGMKLGKQLRARRVHQ